LSQSSPFIVREDILLTDPLELFTDKLRKLREKSELGSIDAAAPKLGVSRGSLGGYERGKRLPDVDFLARLAAATGGDLPELIRLRLAPAMPARR
jgi:transcriptional regulator with XRE-family HTH domain